MIPCPCETGRVRFEPGDQYAFGITTVGGSGAVMRNVASGLSRMGGVLGTVRLEHLDAGWVPWLVAGRFLHAGEGLAFGFGRWLIEDLSDFDPEPFVPAQSYRATLANPVLLAKALEHVVRNRRENNPDATHEDLSDDLPDQLSKTVAEHRYQPGPLHGFVIRKPNGQVRPLAVPGMRDRVLQRAALELLVPAIDVLLEDCSHGYSTTSSRAIAIRTPARSPEFWRIAGV